MSTDPVPVASRQVDPDPSITSAIGRHHSFATAVADLVDNSIDAGARHILIRIMTRDDIPVGLRVIDDGSGMDTAAIDEAMTYARKRAYDEHDLGHFGIGLKSASLSQADRLIVWSRRFGAPAVGRRLLRSTIDTGPIVERYAAEDAEEQLKVVDVDFSLDTGTIVDWTDVRSFLRSTDREEQTAWLEQHTHLLLTHLGLVLHRILVGNAIDITVEQYDVDYGPGAPRRVRPLDPFDIGDRSTAGFPADLTLELPEGHAYMTAHVWPASETGKVGFVLDGRGATQSQGLYVYRRDRLLQAGGWNNIVRPESDLRYARFSLDITSQIDHRVTINPEKTGVVLDATIKDAILAARSNDGRTFGEVLSQVRDGARQARRRTAPPVTLVEPRGGLPRELLDAFADAAEFDPGELEVDIRWKTLSAEEFFRVELEDRILWLNLMYRTSVVGRRSLRQDDAPLVKSLLFLLVNDHFTGTLRGAREKRRERAWQQILVAAARDQQRRLPEEV